MQPTVTILYSDGAPAAAHLPPSQRLLHPRRRQVARRTPSLAGNDRQLSGQRVPGHATGRRALGQSLHRPRRDVVHETAARRPQALEVLHQPGRSRFSAENQLRAGENPTGVRRRQRRPSNSQRRTVNRLVAV